jgi:hypothetical protein
MQDRAPGREAVAREQFAGETAAIAGRLGSVEILAGILAQDHVASVARVAEGLAAGLTAGFPDHRACLLLLETGSRDGTWEALQAWRDQAPSVPPVELLRLGGPPDPARAFRALLETGRRLGVSACLFAQADLVGLLPAWVGRLVEPVLGGQAEAVLPAYSRAVTEGTLTTNLLAPLTRALYGKRVQQLMGGCGALSGGRLGALLEDPVWGARLGPHGIECWLTVEAVAAGRRAVEVPLGAKRVQAPRVQPDLPTILVRTVGPLFDLMERYAGVWLDVRRSAALPCLGDAPGLAGGASGVEIDRMVRAFRIGVKDLLPVWEQIMPEETLGQLYPLGLLAADEFEFAAPLWARVVCDFAVALHERRLAREHLLRALTPLYLGRVAAFFREAQAAPRENPFGLLEAIGEAFEIEAARLRERWR